MAEHIVFDVGQFDRLLSQVSGLYNDLSSSISPGAAGLLGPDLALQPGMQKWNVPADMVAQGQSFGKALGGEGQTLLTELDNLQKSLADARSVFGSGADQAADLAHFSGTTWSEDCPDLCPEPTAQ